LPNPDSTVVSFALTLGDRDLGRFSACAGLGSETEVVEHRETDAHGHPIIRKVPGATKWSNITLKRGLHRSSDLWAWNARAIEAGVGAVRTDGTIRAFNATGEAVAVFHFRAGFPIKYEAGTLGAEANDVAMEEIVIGHDGLTRADGG
jgi:phage tail-like protein